MVLTLGNSIVQMYSFQGEPELPWFQAKPVVTFLGYTNVAQTLEDHVENEDKAALSDLYRTKGAPVGVGISQIRTLGYHEGKAMCFNEYGLYSLVLGSRKREAKEFKRWLTREVLPAIRRHGRYGTTSETLPGLAVAFRSSLALALTERDQAWQLQLASRDAATLQTFREELQPFVGSSILAVHQASAQEFALALATRDAVQLQAVQQAGASILAEVSARLSGFALSFVGHVSYAVTMAVREGLALRRAAPRRRTVNPVEMPEDQRASAVEAGPLSLQLCTVALESSADLPFAAFRKVRSSFGHVAKLERQRLHALGPAHPEYVKKPLLWGFSGVGVQGGGPRYIYQQSERALVRRVYQAQMPTSAAQQAAGAPTPTESLQQRAHRFAAALTPAERAMEWPENTAELEPRWGEE
jgi:prophage antirepressor-like protein